MPPVDSRLVWIDLEMTGLDPDRCHVLQIASLVTDDALQVVAAGPELVVHAAEEALETLSDWSREHFTRTGLLERVRASDVTLPDAEERTLAFLGEHCLPRTAPLCGNSVHTDRAFLWRRMRRLHDFLHYRNVDVSTLKELLRRWFPKRYDPPAKAGRHEAMADLEESLEELRYYRRAFFSPPAPGPSP